jgi:hypothetical protein
LIHSMPGRKHAGTPERGIAARAVIPIRLGQPMRQRRHN